MSHYPPTECDPLCQYRDACHVIHARIRGLRRADDTWNTPEIKSEKVENNEIANKHNVEITSYGKKRRKIANRSDEMLTDLMDIIREDIEETVTPKNNANIQTLPVPVWSISNNDNDRNCSLSEGIRRINFDQNNQNSDAEQQNEELEDIETSIESYIEPNNSVNIEYYPVQKRRPRSTKAEIMRMSKKEKLEKKRKEARANTKNCYDRKKNGILQLKEDLEKAEKDVENMAKEEKHFEQNIEAAFGLIWEYKGYTPEDLKNQFEIEKQEYKKDMNNIIHCPEIIKLNEEVEKATKKFQKVADDIELKNRNANTFGSKKCRAKNEKERAETNLELKIKQLAQIALSKHLRNFQSLRSEIGKHFIDVRDRIGLQGMMNMEPTRKTVFENLLTFFDLPNPV